MRGLDGVFWADLNLVYSLDTLQVSPSRAPSNTEGYQAYLAANAGRPHVPEDVPPPTDVDFPGDYWIARISATGAWAALSEEPDLDPDLVAIVDTGVPESQDALASGRIDRRSSRWASLTGDDSFDPECGGFDHGLYTTGFAAGYAASEAAPRRGANPHSNVVSVDLGRTREISPATETAPRECTTTLISGGAIARAIVRAAGEGASVINVSIGSTTRCNQPSSHRLQSRRTFRASLTNAVASAARNGALVVFSAGNDCEKSDNQLLPTGLLFWRTPDDTAIWGSNALIVAASNDTSQDACFSRLGSVVNLAAPGSAISYGAGVAPNSGTSFSAPLVAGAAGLLNATNDSLRAPEIRDLLLRSATPSLSARSDAHLTAEICEADGERPAQTNADGSMGFVDFVDVEAGASAPRLLNMQAAVQSALIARGVELTDEEGVALDRGDELEVTLEVEVPEGTVSALDVLFIVDQSGSYGNDIDNFQARAEEIIADLSERVDDVQFGVATFSDFPIAPYGSAAANDRAYALLQSMTSDQTAARAAIDLLDQPLRSGADGRESQYEALYQAATGVGRNLEGSIADIPPSPVGWRTGALRVVLFATDASFHDSDTNPSYPGAGRAETLQALQEESLIVFGLLPGAGSIAQLNEVAEVTGGAVLRLDSSGSDIAEAVAAALDDALSNVDVTLRLLSGEGSWVQSVTPEVHEDITPGRTVTFTLALEGQLRSAPTDAAGNDVPYEIYAWALGDGSALLKRSRIQVAIP